jgi:hydrogenase expression/formation protein HypC
MCLAIPGRIVDFVPGQPHLGTVEVAGVRRKVDLGLLAEDPPQSGDWVLIHVGFAMTKISEQDALEQMQMLHMLGETEQAMQEVRGYGLEEGADPSTATRAALETPRAAQNPFAASQMEGLK